MPCASFRAISTTQNNSKLLQCLNELRRTIEINFPSGYVRFSSLKSHFYIVILFENKGACNSSFPRNLSMKNRFGSSIETQIFCAIFHNVRRDSIFPWYEEAAVKESESLFVRKRADKTRDISKTDGGTARGLGKEGGTDLCSLGEWERRHTIVSRIWYEINGEEIFHRVVFFLLREKKNILNIFELFICIRGCSERPSRRSAFKRSYRPAFAMT